MSKSETCAARLQHYEEGFFGKRPVDLGHRCRSSVNTIGSDASAQSLLSSILRLYEREQTGCRPLEINDSCSLAPGPSTVGPPQDVTVQKSTSTCLHPSTESLLVVEDCEEQTIVRHQPCVETKLLHNSAVRLLGKAETTYNSYDEEHVRRPLLRYLCLAMSFVQQIAHDRHVRQLQCLSLLKLVKLCEKTLFRIKIVQEDPLIRRSRDKHIAALFATLDQSVQLIVHVIAAPNDKHDHSLLSSNTRVWSALKAAGLVSQQPERFYIHDATFWAKEHLEFMADSETARNGNIFYVSGGNALTDALDCLGIANSQARRQPFTEAGIQDAVVHHAADCLRCRGLPVTDVKNITGMLLYCYENGLRLRRRLFRPSRLELVHD